MNKRRIPLTDDEPKHRKKSSGKGQPRADHKHIYETVLLHKQFKFDDGKVGDYYTPTKVCTICGRIDRVDKDESYYINSREKALFPWFTHSECLTEKALDLPKWYTEGFFDKTAKIGVKP